MRNILLCGITPEEAEAAEQRTAALCAETGKELKSICFSGRGAAGRDAVLHLRIGRGAGELSPVIPEGQADLLIGTDPGELLRNLRLLRLDGTAVLIRRAETEAQKARRAAELKKSGYDPERCRKFMERRLRHCRVLTDAELLPEKLIANCVRSI